MLLLMVDLLLPFIAFLFVTTFSFYFPRNFLNSFTIFFLSYPLRRLIFPKFLYMLPLSHNLSMMLPAKGESSSRCKGKEVTADNPPVMVVGGEAPHSESHRSEEEERGCDPGSKCPPLINPWYDTHIHFSVVPDD